MLRISIGQLLFIAAFLISLNFTAEILGGKHNWEFAGQLTLFQIIALGFVLLFSFRNRPRDERPWKVLGILNDLGPATSHNITRELERRSGRLVDYISHILHHLEDVGYLYSYFNWEDTPQGRRKLWRYEITPQGKHALNGYVTSLTKQFTLKPRHMEH